MLADLDKLEAGDAEFEELLGKFIVAAREHIEFEETQVWPRTALGAARRDVGRARHQDRRRQEDRAHAAASAYAASPGVLKTAGPAVAAADKARDKLTGRGSD